MVDLPTKPTKPNQTTQQDEISHFGEINIDKFVSMKFSIDVSTDKYLVQRYCNIVVLNIY